MLIPVAFQQNHRDEVRLINGDGAIAGALAAEAGMKQQNYVGVPISFDWQAGDGGNDASFRGKSRSYIVDKPGSTRALTNCKTLAVAVPVAFTTEQTPKFNNDCALTLTKQSPTGGGQPQAIAVPTEQAMKVRRLTPRECERLQAFQWRCAPTDPGAWQDELGRWWSPDYTAGFSDSTRYKMLGNAVCVNVIEWIARRIATDLNS